MAATLTPVISSLPDNLQSWGRSWALSLRAARKAERTQRLYIGGLVALSRFLEDRGMPTDPASISGEHVREFLADQVARLSPATARARHAYLSVFFNWLVGEGELRESPMRRIKPPALDERLPEILDDVAFAKLLRACQGRGLTERRDLAMLRLMEETGIRRAECATLRLEDVDLDELTVTVMGKGRRVRVCPFTPQTATAIDRYLRERSRTRWARDPALWIGHVGPISPNAIGEMLERRSLQAGLGRRVKPHSLRHRFADHWKADGGSEDSLMALGGWRSRDVMARYGRANEQRRAIDEYRRLRGDQ